jgi:hypothetical protein
LVQSNPAASDPLSGADDHLRLLKSTVKNTLAHTGALTNTDNQLIPAAGTSAKPAYSFAAEPTLGLYRSAAGVISVGGGQLKNAAPLGSVHMFLVDAANIGNAVKGSAGQPYEFLELDGATWPNSVYPALAAYLGQGGSTFTLPNMYTAGRFPRSRTAATAALTAQANTVGPHTHPNFTGTTAAETQEHTHTFSGTTGSMNRNASHAHSVDNWDGGAVNAGGGSGGLRNPLAGVTGTTNTDHEHAFSGTTAGRSATHNHAFTVSTPANTGTTETRPEAMSFVFAVKT